MINELLIVLFSAFFNDGDKATVAYYEMSGDVSKWMMWLVRWSGSITGLLLAVLSIMFTIWLVRGWQWRLVFALLATMFVVGAAVREFFPRLIQMTGRGNVAELALWTNLSIDVIPTAILLLCLALAMIEDRRMAISRHWSHWVGVGVYLSDGTFKLVKYAVWYLLLGGM